MCRAILGLQRRSVECTFLCLIYGRSKKLHQLCKAGDDIFASKSAAVVLDAGFVRLGKLFTFLLSLPVLGHSRM